MSGDKADLRKNARPDESQGAGGNARPDETSTVEFKAPESRQAAVPPVVTAAAAPAAQAPAPGDSPTQVDPPLDARTPGEVPGPGAAAATITDGEAATPAAPAPPDPGSSRTKIFARRGTGGPGATGPVAVARAASGPAAATDVATAVDAGSGTAVLPGGPPQGPGGGHLPEDPGERAAVSDRTEPAAGGFVAPPPMADQPVVPFEAGGIPGVPPGSGPPTGAATPPAGGHRRLLVLLLGAGALAVVLVVAALFGLSMMTGRSGRTTGGQAKPGTASVAPTHSPSAPGDGQGAPQTSAPAAPGQPGPSGGPATGGPLPGSGAGTSAGTGAGAGTGTPPGAPAAQAPAGPLVRGDGMTYQLMQRDEGYYEGGFTVTNRTGRPMTTWSLVFHAPGAKVKHVWGGRLVHGGEDVLVENAPGAAAVPPGASIEIRFGAEGAPVDPQGCRFNKAGCGF